MMDLYMPYTNYHTLLSLAIVLSNKDVEHHLLLTNPSLMRLCQIFNLKNLTLSSLEYDDRRNNLHSFYIKKRNLRIIARKLSDMGSIGSCFYFCEWNVYTTYLTYLAHKMSPKTRFCLVEDGVSTYVEPTRKTKNILERISNYVIYGSWHKDFYKPGTMFPKCDVYALLPELLGDNFCKNTKHKICIDALLDNVNELALSEIIDGKNGSYAPDIEVLIALDFNPRYTNGDCYKNTMTQLIYDTAHCFSSVAIKRHPADDKHINFIPNTINNVFELEASLPIEFYYLKFRKTLKKVVGCLSTSLLTAHCMLPEAEIISIVSQEDIKREKQAPMIIQLFKHLGVEIKIV